MKKLQAGKKQVSGSNEVVTLPVGNQPLLGEVKKVQIPFHSICQ